MIAMVEHATIGPLKALGVPVKLSDTPGAVRTPPPTLGQHTDAVLRHDLGFSADADRRPAPAEGDLKRHGNLRCPQTTDRDDRAREEAGRRSPRAQRSGVARLRRRFCRRSRCRSSARSPTPCKADGYAFTVFTPSGSVRLMSDRSRGGLHRAVARHRRRSAAGDGPDQPHPRPPRDRRRARDRHARDADRRRAAGVSAEGAGSRSSNDRRRDRAEEPLQTGSPCPASCCSAVPAYPLARRSTNDVSMPWRLSAARKPGRSGE